MAAAASFHHVPPAIQLTSVHAGATPGPDSTSPARELQRLLQEFSIHERGQGSVAGSSCVTSRVRPTSALGSPVASCAIQRCGSHPSDWTQHELWRLTQETQLEEPAQESCNTVEWQESVPPTPEEEEASRQQRWEQPTPSLLPSPQQQQQEQVPPTQQVPATQQGHEQELVPSPQPALSSPEPCSQATLWLRLQPATTAAAAVEPASSPSELTPGSPFISTQAREQEIACLSSLGWVSEPGSQEETMTAVAVPADTNLQQQQERRAGSSMEQPSTEQAQTLDAIREAFFAQYAEHAGPPPQQQQQPDGLRAPEAPQPLPGAAPMHAEAATASAMAEACVAQTCYPHLADVLSFFATQREAFDYADQLNSQLLQLGDPTLITSRVAPAELLPAQRGREQQQQQQQQQQLQAAGSTLTSSMRDGQRGASSGREAQAPAAAAAVIAPEQQQQSAQPLAGRPWLGYGGAEPTACDGYNAPEVKRQRHVPTASTALEQFRVALAAFQTPAVGSEVTEQPDRVAAAVTPAAAGPPGRSGAEGQAGATTPDGVAAPAASACSEGQAAAAVTVQQQQQQLHEECVKVFCVERRGR